MKSERTTLHLIRFSHLLVTFSLLGCESAPMATVIPQWTLEREITIGSVDDPELGMTRVGTVTVDGDGNIFVTQPDDDWIRVFSPDGNFLYDIGRGGNGPGEFQLMWRVGWLGDTLWVSEMRAPKVSFFEKDGTFLSSVSLNRALIDGVFTPASVQGVLQDRTYLVQASFSSSLAMDGTITAYPFYRMDSKGVVLGKVLDLPMGNSPVLIPDADRPMIWRNPFPEGPAFAASPTGEFVLVLQRKVATDPDSATMRLDKISMSGDTIFTRYVPYSPVPVSATIADSIRKLTADLFVKSRYFASHREALQAYDRYLPAPEFHPPATRVFAAFNGEIWVQQRVFGTTEDRWDLLSADGSLIAYVIVPKSTMIHQSDGTNVWATELDELDVPYVVRYRLVREIPTT